MHEFLSFFAELFLSPLNWIIILIIIQFIVRTAKAKKICWVSVLIIFLLFSSPWLLNTYARFWDAAPKDVTADKPYSCGIVLGGFASPDENGNGYFNTSADRFIQAVKLYKLGKIKHVIISGGNGKDSDRDFEEGKWTKSQLQLFGIPADAILYEDLSNNTADNAANVKKILDSNSLLPPYLLITSAPHILRASQIFKNAGVPVIAYPCNYEDGRGSFKLADIIPDSETLINWNKYLKETCGYFLYNLKGRRDRK